MGHANLFSSRSFILCRFHGHLLFVWSCCHSLTLMSNRSASIFLKVMFSITYWIIYIISDYRRTGVGSSLIKKATLMEGKIGKVWGKLFIISRLPTVYFSNSSCSLMQLFPICVDRKPLELTGIKISTLYYNSILHESVTGSTKLCMFLIQSEGLSLCYISKLPAVSQ